jgi:hypothetical protein
MQFSPSFYQTPLPLRELTGDQFDRVDAKNGYMILIPGVKMRPVGENPAPGTCESRFQRND